ncbi:hypothetical protein ILYODFUR_026005 [Ilyodon furcidens]|uniref:Uncharacterized protein n=1 Tax=Ilyodon furcidens TaxID=33524 RepID=A0ABV0VH86_9TELE
MCCNENPKGLGQPEARLQINLILLHPAFLPWKVLVFRSSVVLQSNELHIHSIKMMFRKWCNFRSSLHKMYKYAHIKKGSRQPDTYQGRCVLQPATLKQIAVKLHEASYFCTGGERRFTGGCLSKVKQVDYIFLILSC